MTSGRINQVAILMLSGCVQQTRKLKKGNEAIVGFTLNSLPIIRFSITNKVRMLQMRLPSLQLTERGINHREFFSVLFDHFSQASSSHSCPSQYALVYSPDVQRSSHKGQWHKQSYMNMKSILSADLPAQFYWFYYFAQHSNKSTLSSVQVLCFHRLHIGKTVELRPRFNGGTSSLIQSCLFIDECFS